MWTDPLIMPADQVGIVEMSRQGIVRERFTIFHRCPVWRVRIPEIDVQIPVVGGCIAFQPRKKNRIDLLCGLLSAFADVVDFSGGESI